MISMSEILKGKKLEEQSPEIQANLEKLLNIANQLRTLWGKPMTITSGLRDMSDMMRIYKAKGITDPTKIPWKSAHLFGLALDVSDPSLELTEWLKQHPEIMEQLDIYCELGNKNWTHIQLRPFASYKHGGPRWFKP